MDRRSFIIQQQQINNTLCGEEECICGEDKIVVSKAQQRIKPQHLFSTALLSFVAAVAFLVVEKNEAKAALLRQIKATVIPCSTFTDDIVLPKHSDPSDNNSNCPHQLSTGFLFNNDSKRKKINHC